MSLFCFLPQSRFAIVAPGWLARAAWHLLLVFLARHWLVAVANAGLTALIGLALLRLVPHQRSPQERRASGLSAFLFQDLDLRLRRFLLAAALCKGAFYLILGDGHRFLFKHATPLAYGFQMPDPGQMFRLISQNPETIWRPTAASGQLGVLLGGMALVLLVRRAKQIRDLLAWLEALAGQVEVTDADQTRVRSSLGRAAAALGISSSAPLPRPLLAEVSVPTPVLVGLRHPYVLLAPSLAAILSDAELDVVLRHELTHFRRRDQWWRWLLLLAEDIGCVNPLSGWLGTQAMEGEENICDRWAVASAQEAAALGRAIAKSRAHTVDPRCHFALTRPVRVTPQLLGVAQPSQSASLERRLRILLALASAYQAPPAPPRGCRKDQDTRNGGVPHRGLTLLLRLWTLLVAGLIMAVIYAKFLLILNVQ